jgi:hypothetical protein
MICITAAVYMTVIGCAKIKYYTPLPTEANYHLDGLPAESVKVIVNDLRPNLDHEDGLASVVKTQLWAALYPQPSKQLSEKYRIIVDIINHHSFYASGSWNASTRFRIRLIDSEGKMLNQWEAKGSAQISSMWHLGAAEDVSQDSYDGAVSDMMSYLSHVTVP